MVCVLNYNTACIRVLRSVHFRFYSVFKLFFLFALTLIISGCFCGDSFSDRIKDLSSPGSCPSETDIPPVDAVLAKINSFKNSIASEAGNNSVSLRAFQTAEIGDIYILDQNDESIQSYIGSAEVVVPLGEADEESRIANLGSFS